jgi:hypothetical protein
MGREHKRSLSHRRPGKAAADDKKTVRLSAPRVERLKLVALRGKLPIVLAKKPFEAHMLIQLKILRAPQTETISDFFGPPLIHDIPRGLGSLDRNTDPVRIVQGVVRTRKAIFLVSVTALRVPGR